VETGICARPNYGVAYSPFVKRGFEYRPLLLTVEAHPSFRLIQSRSMNDLTVSEMVEV
jgi:hypothetical protein